MPPLLPVSTLELSACSTLSRLLAHRKVLELLTSKVAPQSGCTGGWYASRVRGGITTTIPGLPTALR